MDKNSNNNNSNRLGFMYILTIIFVIAKILGFIKWSWWLVFAPIYIPILIFLVVYIVASCISKILE